MVISGIYLDIHSKVQYIKIQVLREVAKSAFAGTLAEDVLSIPEKVIPGNKPTMRCCVYKERAIIGERVKLAMGGHKENPNVIEVIKIACDECRESGYEITDNCRGCIAHYCKNECRMKAISFNENRKATIDKSKCVQCGKCAGVCPYGAIVNHRRPCEKACKVKAIGVDEDKAAMIKNEECIACGACVYQCPFGAIMEKSYITEAIEILKNAKEKGEKVYAVVAPSIAVQYGGVTVGQVAEALKQLGFDGVEEAALGADMTAVTEASELVEKGMLTTSCCPAFVTYVKKHFPDMAEMVSSTPSPMVTISKAIKKKEPNAKVIFIGPCTAKKGEVRLPEVKPYVDTAITFEELIALFWARDIDVSKCEDRPLDSATRYGRNFAASGGVTAAVRKTISEPRFEYADHDFVFKPVAASGVDECRVALLRAGKGLLDGNFIEGMACVGGCINGAASLVHSEKSKAVLEKHSAEVGGRWVHEYAQKGFTYGETEENNRQKKV